MINILLALLGVFFVLQGADKLTDGAVDLARRFSIPEMVIGLTVVAFGTSLPEFIVSLMASLDGAAAMGIGNVLGSNLFNTLMIVGVTSAISPIAVQKSTIYKDIPFSLLACVVLTALTLDHVFVHPGVTDQLNRSDGIALLGFFAVFMAYTFAISHPATSVSPNANETPDTLPVSSASTIPQLPTWKVSLFIVGGLAGLIIGGEMFVRGASGIARGLGVSEAVIGLTLVAGGTSLPELATSIMAARKGQSGIAIGNVIGSNLFNIFWILGFCSCISPMPADGITTVDFAVLILSAILFWLFSRTQHLIRRWEGIFHIVVYCCYIGRLIASI